MVEEIIDSAASKPHTDFAWPCSGSSLEFSQIHSLLEFCYDSVRVGICKMLPIYEGKGGRQRGTLGQRKSNLSFPCKLCALRPARGSPDAALQSRPSFHRLYHQVELWRAPSSHAGHPPYSFLTLLQKTAVRGLTAAPRPPSKAALMTCMQVDAT